MRFLFWNTNKRNLDSYISSLIVEHQIDVFCAAEYAGNVNDLCASINQNRKYDEILTPGCDRITIIGDPTLFSVCFQNSYCSFQFVVGKLILCVVHLPSKLHNDNGRREIVIDEIIEQINLLETNKGTDKTVVFGDFNINPYEDACLRVDKFHSISVDFESVRGSREVAGKKFKMFYNPMWNCLGDRSFPPGTYYLASGDSICPYWNVYDQVIIRPSLIDSFKKDKLQIITKCNDKSLIDKNNHPRKEISDHLPIIFELEV